MESAIFPALWTTLLRSEECELWKCVLLQVRKYTHRFEPLELYAKTRSAAAQGEIDNLAKVSASASRHNWGGLSSVHFYTDGASCRTDI